MLASSLCTVTARYDSGSDSAAKSSVVLSELSNALIASKISFTGASERMEVDDRYRNGNCCCAVGPAAVVVGRGGDAAACDAGIRGAREWRWDSARITFTVWHAVPVGKTLSADNFAHLPLIRSHVSDVMRHPGDSTAGSRTASPTRAESPAGPS